MKTIWALPIKRQPGDGPWRCPRCDKACVYGGQRSLWSMIPGVCRHVVIDFTDMPFKNGLVYVSLPGPIIKARRSPYEPSFISIIATKIRTRLSDEIKGNRDFWWGGYSAEYLTRQAEVRRELKQLGWL